MKRKIIEEEIDAYDIYGMDLNDLIFWAKDQIELHPCKCPVLDEDVSPDCQRPLLRVFRYETDAEFEKRKKTLDKIRASKAKREEEHKEYIRKEYDKIKKELEEVK